MNASNSGPTMAPTLIAPSSEKYSSGVRGMNMKTRSPFPTPSLRNTLPNLLLIRFKSANVYFSSRRSSL